MWSRLLALVWCLAIADQWRGWVLRRHLWNGTLVLTLLLAPCAASAGPALLLDANNGGSAVAIPDTLQKAYDTLTDVETIVTGHSTLMTRADLLEYADFNRDFLSAVKAAKEAGQSVDEIASSWKIPPQYVGYAEPQPARVRNNASLAYQELEATGSR